MVTNGEHNGLRIKGNTRPLHVFQVRAQVRAKVSKTKAKTLLAMLTPKGRAVITVTDTCLNIYMYVTLVLCSE